MLYSSPAILSSAGVIKADLTIASDVYDIVLKDWIMSQIGWDGIKTIEANITVAPGVVCGSTRAYSRSQLRDQSTYSPSFTRRSDSGFFTGVFPEESIINLLVSPGAYIVGYGGGGVGRPLGTRYSGGHCMWIEYPIFIDNQGTISGGGGGGGSSVYVGGGGGAGQHYGLGQRERNSGRDGSLTSGGSPRGGSLGSNGGSGDWGARGLAGYAVSNGANLITWINVGDRRGGLRN